MPTPKPSQLLPSKPGDEVAKAASKALGELAESARANRDQFALGLPPEDSPEWDDNSAITITVNAGGVPAVQATTSDSSPPPAFVRWAIAIPRGVLGLFDKPIRGWVAVALLVCVIIEWFRPGSVLQEWARPEKVRSDADTDVLGDDPAAP